MGESERPVRRYFSKEAKSKLVREARALEDDEGGYVYWQCPGYGTLATCASEVEFVVNPWDGSGAACDTGV